MLYRSVFKRVCFCFSLADWKKQWFVCFRRDNSWLAMVIRGPHYIFENGNCQWKNSGEEQGNCVLCGGGDVFDDLKKIRIIECLCLVDARKVPITITPQR